MKLGLQVEERTLRHRIDWNVALVILALNVIGAINVYSATHQAGTTAGLDRLFIQQVSWILLGWIMYIIVTLMDYRILQRFVWAFYGINLFMLMLVPLIGKTALGATRWLNFGAFLYQPSETMKLSIILVMSQILSKKSKPEGLGLLDLIIPGIFAVIPFALIAKQPDLGTGMMVGSIAVAMVLFVGLQRKIIITAIVAGAVAMPVVWSYGLKQYQKDRVLTFIDPGRDPKGTGWNSIQSKIAVGSGQILGKGFRKGTQSQLEFLPEPHTDFIFSVLSEEHGFLGSTITLGLFVMLFIRGLRVASQARDKFGALVTVGVISYLFIAMTINVGMVIGLLPIVGVPLPLVSYGGSSTLTTMFCLGLVSSVSMRRYLF